ncbi:diguanylate cyclase [Euzebya sp.]|uniref:sensor domain-containing diguanylate cyclase n=1 Tax=Euzebya sp. TaxID=1971409 RepID=UPI003514AD84
MRTPRGDAGALDPSVYRRMVEVSDDGILAVDGHGIIAFANPAAARMLGRPAAVLRGLSFGVPIVAGGAAEIRLLHARRGVRVAELRAASVPQGDAADVTHIVMLRDITRSARTRSELQRLALADHLTGVGNRRAFLALADQALKVAEREQRACLLVFVDIDRMKAINDRFGHRAGDQAVVETAQMLTDTVRDADIVARIGGDEFCVLLTGAPGRPESLDEALERLREATARLGERTEFPLSVTIGDARTEPGEHWTVAELMEAADARMYEAKRRRDRDVRVVVIGDGSVGRAVREAVGDELPVLVLDAVAELADRVSPVLTDVVVVAVADLPGTIADLGTSPRTTGIPVVAHQPTPDAEQERMALDLGAADVITGEMAPPVVLARIRRVLGQMAL